MALGNLSETSYKIWQQRLVTNPLFRYWWQFWSNYAFVFYIAVATYLAFSPDVYKLIWLSAGAFFIARFVVTVIINLFYKKQRPYQKFKFEPITSNFFSLRTNEPNSFPSRHAITFTSVATVIFVFNPVVGLMLLVVTVMTGIARVILGYHWPADILAGLILGSITGYVVTTIGLSQFFT